ncbi:MULTISPECIES: hypothetical protein [unclassified Actinobaculum]|uniref:hypothetical protein n=1 Tax=unclassified Actinobaculum TaxID=2609299 RepID=UPI000D5260B6|nr:MULTISPECIES: hypothetical protein [unclassified Actinobaculum]AWE42978.1 hypothetical protein DDD63_09780 [Actinobaculum sp. 313]RTE48931.1 hypothetical protein EKN07_07280 [Actinobaculum sp. 352]
MKDARRVSSREADWDALQGFIDDEHIRAAHRRLLELGARPPDPRSMADRLDRMSNCYERLQANGFIDDGRLTRGARHLLEAYLNPVQGFRLELAISDRRYESRIWVAANHVGFIEERTRIQLLLRRIHPGVLPTVIVDMLGIGPRRQIDTDATLDVPTQYITDLIVSPFRGRPGQFAEHVESTFPTVAADLRKNRWSCWMLSRLDITPDDFVGRGSLAALDTPSALLGVELRGKNSRLVPLNSQRLWMLLADGLGVAS